MQRYVLALDQGTTSSRACLFDHSGTLIHQAQREFPQILPRSGEVEHDPEQIWSSQLAVARQVLAESQVGPERLVALGIANQRETTILWERATGRPVANAIVWQSRVSAPICRRLRDAGHEDVIRERTGLLLDPYFSATKICHLLESVSGLRARAERGEILFGTVDTFLAWRLTNGQLHVTDASNASRTLLMNLETLAWDPELLRLFEIPPAILPRIVASSEVCGTVAPEILGAPVPLAGIAGDQQAATFGQACFAPGMAKNTYGTGCFLLLNTGPRPVRSAHRLLTTVGWRIGQQVHYCLEGSVFVAGAAVQWLRDGLGLIGSSAEVERLAATVPDAGGLILVPAFTGLGAPYWDPQARGALLGITRGTTAGHVARATIESMAYQTAELLAAMQQDTATAPTALQVDGGAAVNDALLQFQADLLGLPVRRPQVFETTALGAAYLAGLAVGFWESLDAVAANWRLDREFAPQQNAAQRTAQLRRWRRAVERALDWEEAG